MPKPFYITTTLPYVNAEPHIGFALELISADIIARYKKLLGYEVFFNTGTDEYGVKVYRKAKEEGKDPQVYVNECAEKYRSLISSLGISPDIHFIRTTNRDHKKAAEEMWKRCAANGDIYKKKYRITYCVGCELEKTDSELLDGKCAIHPNLSVEIIEEENYFFRLSNYQKKLLELYESRPDLMIPTFRLNEIHALIQRKGLEDFSISRLKAKMPWGVPVPGDDTQVMYVWFDALINYISTLGWPSDEKSFKKWWIESGGVVQYAGKDQVRQQGVMWQAMLLSAGLTPSRQIVIHGFITSGGKKMSKSLGNVIDPNKLIDEFGGEAVRFLLARHISPFEDSDFTTDKFKKAYNADLANGIGNLTSRIMKMSQEHIKDTNIRMGANDTNRMNKKERGVPQEFKKALDAYNIQRAAEIITERVNALDKRIQETEPFKLVKTDKPAAQKIIAELVAGLSQIAHLLLPIIPDTAAKIQSLIESNKMPDQSLFPRK